MLWRCLKFKKNDRSINIVCRCLCTQRVATARLNRSSEIRDEEDYKQFDVQSGRGSSADQQRSTISVAAAADASQQPAERQRQPRRPGHGATFQVGHNGPQEATPRDETSSASTEWAYEHWHSLAPVENLPFPSPSANSFLLCYYCPTST